jgi:hypothetical protein
MTRLPSIRIAVASAFLASSCMTTKKVTLIENLDAATRPARVDVMFKGTKYPLNEPFVRGDSLHGWQEGRPNHPLSFAVSEIERVTVQQLSSGRTVGLIGLGIVATFGFWFLLIVTSGGISPQF